MENAMEIAKKFGYRHEVGGVAPMTRRDVRARAIERGAHERVADTICAVTAFERHNYRVDKTLDAAVSVVGDVTIDDGAQTGEIAERAHPSRAAAAAAILLDMGARQSQRIGPFAGLGKGRWHASDGGAYEAAAREACFRLDTRGPEFMVTEHGLVIEVGGVDYRVDVSSREPNKEQCVYVEPVGHDGVCDAEIRGVEFVRRLGNIAHNHLIRRVATIVADGGIDVAATDKTAAVLAGIVDDCEAALASAGDGLAQ